MTCNIAKKKLPSPGTRSERGAKRKEKIVDKKIVTNVLNKCKEIQIGRVTNNVTTVTFSSRSKIERTGLPGYHSH
jgi:hypothetical protein